jgi:3-deoxy-D-manno-octulosonic-acid transferase
VESEFWPITLQAVKDKGLPLMLVNARLSDRSAERWQKFPEVIAHVLGLFDLILAQSDDDAARLTKLGARNVTIAGNMKYAGSPLLFDTPSFQTLQAQIGARPVILFASTHDGEEAYAINSYEALMKKHPGLLVIVMPRHPSRGDAVKALIEKDGLKLSRRSKQEAITAETQIYLADTLGEPGLFFRLCKIVYVGNSLINVPGGGHNPIEPAQLGCAIVYGPNMWNFAEIDRDLRKIDAAIMVRSEQTLHETFDRLLSEPLKAEQMGQLARDFMSAQNGVLDTVLGYLRPGLVRAGISA